MNFEHPAVDCAPSMRFVFESEAPTHTYEKICTKMRIPATTNGVVIGAWQHFFSNLIIRFAMTLFDCDQASNDRSDKKNMTVIIIHCYH